MVSTDIEIAWHVDANGPKDEVDNHVLAGLREGAASFADMVAYFARKRRVRI
jgi:hypothetical protein